MNSANQSNKAYKTFSRYNHLYFAGFKETKSNKILVKVDGVFDYAYYGNKSKFWEIKRDIKDFTDEKLQELFKIIKAENLWYIFNPTPFTVGEVSYMFRGETLKVWNYKNSTCRDLTFKDFKNLTINELNDSFEHFVELCNHFVNFYLQLNRNLDRSKYGEITNIDEFYNFCKIYNVDTPYRREYIENAFSVRDWYDI